MIKRALRTIGLAITYLVALASGSFLRPFGIMRVLDSHGLGVRLYIWDGMLLTLILYTLTLVVEALSR